MLDQRGRPQAPRQLSSALPVAPRAARALVLTAVFVCAACGLVYELELVALASYLVGDSVTQASLVLSVMVFAMGCGSLLAKRLRNHAAAAFVAVESALALVGGLSVMTLYAVFAWYGQARFAMIGCAFAIGVLIGAEVPLLMTLVQRIRRQDAGGAVADLFAADYVGALVGGLAFSFLLLPFLGQLTGALATGAVNAVAGGAIVLWLFRGDLSARASGWLLTANVGVLALLACAAVGAAPFERAARHAVYGSRVRVAEQTGAEEIVLAGGTGVGGGSSLRLYVDGDLTVCGPDATAHHQALVEPAMAGPHARVLVLGGGDGLALREVLRHRGVSAVTVVPGDPELARLGREDPGLTALNGHAFDDPRVREVGGDVFDWLRTSVRGRSPTRRPYDVIIEDLPEPGNSDSAKLYSQEFYGLAAHELADGGRFAVDAGSSTHTLWTTDATLHAVSLSGTPYAMTATRACSAPADWNFLLAAPTSAPPRLVLPAGPSSRRVLTLADLRAAEGRADRTRPDHRVPPSTLLRPRITE
ncbi:putative spermidine synthase [Actinacidiphila reveromycinica]|uniref:Polyamine aminopropyltransferase n=1 Tax=Actinacidiphila reveromycinica TaxID=659352 RepID=A0A7U3VPY0_9ACTN|nr:polyamine aminopropyltransferase [Streptomyces sp. SN-593]BBA99094.1 putative spermidine synthase [Streptomyces sp. SN-593]